MVQVDVMPRGINPKITEQYLLSLNDVLDASVLWCEGDLHAYITVPEDEVMSRGDIQKSCMEELGLHQTPRQITFMRARTRLRAA
jgi:hypothetical protein